MNVSDLFLLVGCVSIWDVVGLNTGEKSRWGRLGLGCRAGEEREDKDVSKFLPVKKGCSCCHFPFFFRLEVMFFLFPSLKIERQSNFEMREGMRYCAIYR